MTNQELRPPRQFLEDVLGLKHGDTAWESSQIEQIEAYIRDSQLTILDQVRMEKDTYPCSCGCNFGAACLCKEEKFGHDKAVTEFNQRIDTLKAGIEKGEA